MAVIEPVPERTGWSWVTDPERWDERQRRYSGSFIHTIDRIDRFFGDDPLTDDNQRSSMALGIGLKVDGDGKASLITDLRLRLVMPRLKDRFQLVLDDTFAVDDPRDEQAVIDAVRETRPDAGIRYLIRDAKHLRISTDLGIRTSDPVQLFGRGRWRLSLPTAAGELRLAETVYWFTDDGWRETSEVSWSRPLAGFWIFRNSTRLTWEERRNGVTPGHTVELTRPLGKSRAYRLYATGTWPEAPHTQEANYVVGMVFRQRIHRDWLFMEISPSFEFPQLKAYAVNPIIRLKFDIIFSDE